jgi:hypothetical protein
MRKDHAGMEGRKGPGSQGANRQGQVGGDFAEANEHRITSVLGGHRGDSSRSTSPSAARAPRGGRGGRGYVLLLRVDDVSKHFAYLCIIHNTISTNPTLNIPRHPQCRCRHCTRIGSVVSGARASRACMG